MPLKGIESFKPAAFDSEGLKMGSLPSAFGYIYIAKKLCQKLKVLKSTDFWGFSISHNLI
jgi:hypothetical protein